MFVDATLDPEFGSWILIMPNPSGFGEIVYPVPNVDRDESR